MTLLVTLHFLDAFLVLLLSFVADGSIGVKVEATTIIGYVSGKLSPVAQIIQRTRTRHLVTSSFVTRGHDENSIVVLAQFEE